MDHWRRGHKQMCKKIHRGGNAEQYHADKKYKEAVAEAVEKCADDTKGQDVVGEIPSTIDDLLKMIQNAVDGGIGDIENLIGQIVSALDGVDLPPEVQKLVDEIVKFLNGNAPIVGGPGPEIEVGNATTLPAPVPEPEDADKPLEPKTPAAPAPQEETTPLQDYATYEATKDISDPNTAAAAGAAAAQVAGALQ